MNFLLGLILTVVMTIDFNKKGLCVKGLCVILD
jgi:hypothetical protein